MTRANDLTPIQRLRQPGLRHDLVAEVSRLRPAPRAPSKLQEGTLQDDSGTIGFVLWAGAGAAPLEPGRRYLLMGARLREYRGRLELHLDRGTRVVSWDGSAPAPAAAAARPARRSATLRLRAEGTAGTALALVLLSLGCAALALLVRLLAGL